MAQTEIQKLKSKIKRQEKIIEKLKKEAKGLEYDIENKTYQFDELEKDRSILRDAMVKFLDLRIKTDSYLDLEVK